MTSIDFYILEDEKFDAPFRLACQLILQFYRQGKKVFVHTGERKDAERIDEYLWTQELNSFVPHQLTTEVSAFSAPVQIGHGQEPLKIRPDVMVNLSADIPAFFSHFERVLEFAHGDEEKKEQARNRFRFYKERGYPLQHKTVPQPE